MSMDFLKFKKNVAKTAMKAKEVSENMVEVAKCKFKLSEINGDIEDKYIEIGKLVYKDEDTKEAADAIQKLCEDISELKSKSEDLKEIINDIANKKECPECKNKMDQGFSFCPICGYSFENKDEKAEE